MSTLALTFHGSILELLGWIAIGVVYLALAFVAGWFLRYMREDR